MKKSLIIAFAFTLVTGFANAQQKGDYIKWTTKNDKMTADGSLEKFNVKSATFDAKKVESVKAVIEVETASIKTANKMLNDHLKAEDFLSVMKIPNATITVDGAKASGDGYTTDAKLNMKGIESTVQLTFKVINEKKGIVEGSGVINRNTHNVGKPDGHYGLIPEVTISFRATLK